MKSKSEKPCSSVTYDRIRLLSGIITTTRLLAAPRQQAAHATQPCVSKPRHERFQHAQLNKGQSSTARWNMQHPPQHLRRLTKRSPSSQAKRPRRDQDTATLKGSLAIPFPSITPLGRIKTADQSIHGNDACMSLLLLVVYTQHGVAPRKERVS